MTHPDPFFSVIVPTYNRATQLGLCVQALAAQDYPRERFEVIVADDGSHQPPREIVGSIAKSLNITLVIGTHDGPSAARNAGAARARGEFLAFTDDDCEPAADWLSRLAVHLTSFPTGLVGGRTINVLRGNIYSDASQTLIDILYAHFNPHPDHARFFASNNIAMRAAEFHAIGGFMPGFRWAEDRELCDRWLHQGGRMLHAPDALVHHRHDLNFITLWRQHFNYGRGAFLFHKMRARRGSGELRPDPSFYLELFRYPLTNVAGMRGLLIEALMAEMQLANAAGFFSQAIKGAGLTLGGLVRSARRPSANR
jgi:glycosyltransferase involved in cell wall biosynthesis